MAFEDDPDDERPPSGNPLPPEDRLWRHPSEVAHGDAIPGTWVTRPAPDRPSRGMVLAALVSATLAGAVVAVGIMWVARPTRVVTRDVDAAAATVTTASFGRNPVTAGELADRYAPALARVEASGADGWTAGTGVWLDDQGTLVVPTSLVRDASEIEVQPLDGDPVTAQVVQLDDATGITILHAQRTLGTPISAADGGARAGQVVAAIAAPAAGHDGSETQDIVTAGVKDVGTRCTVGDWVLHDGITLDRAISEDAVGAVLVDGDGELVGIVLAGEGSGSGAVAVPADQALDAAALLRDNGSVPRAWLGVRATDVDDAHAEDAGISRGALITTVQAGSPADAAGLEAGDIVTQVDERSIADASDLVVALRSWEPGERVTVTWRRGPTPGSAEVTLGG